MTAQQTPAPSFPPIDDVTNELSHRVIGAAIAVHRMLGPGHFESVYDRAMHLELDAREIPHRSQVAVPVLYRGCVVGEFVPDLVVHDRLVVELKAAAKNDDVYRSQTLAYMRATNLRLGLIINFQVAVLKYGLTRVVL